MNVDYERTALGSIEAMMIRGGTSRGLFLREADVPVTGDLRDELVLELLGSPDPLQLSGVGGGKSHLSKVMIVDPYDGEDADVQSTFAQVSVETPDVDWTRNNGNLSAAIGPFAILEGLVPATEPVTDLTFYNTNTGKYIDQSVPVEDGEPAIYGDYAIDGVPGTGAKVETTFRDPGGAVTGSLLPMGEPVTTFAVDGGEIEASVVDSATLGISFRAEELGLTGTELPDELEANDQVLDTIEEVRDQIRAELGLEHAKRSNPSAAIVSGPQSYEDSLGEPVEGDDTDVTVRFVSLQPHHAASLTGSMSLTTATKIPGTIPNECVRSAEPRSAEDSSGRSPRGGTGETVRIGHPKGTIDIGADVSGEGVPDVHGVTYWRTTCPVFHGRVYYRYLGGLERLR